MFIDYKVAYMLDNVKVKEVKRFSFLRTSLAYLFSLAARQVPHAAMTNEYDMTDLMDYCSRRDAEIKASPDAKSKEAYFHRALLRNQSAFLFKAFSHALSHTPCMNAFLDYSPILHVGKLYHAEDVNLGITVHTKYGVVRPILRNAHTKTLDEVATEVRDLARRARITDPEELYWGAARAYLGPSIRQLDPRALFAGFLLARGLLFQRFKPSDEYKKIPKEDKLTVHEILGSTCSVASIGSMVEGHQTVTVISPPEVMMFGLGDIHLTPKVVNGEVVPRHVMTVCATMDHRAFDAGEAFPIGKYLLKYFKNPELIYDWKPGDDI